MQQHSKQHLDIVAVSDLVRQHLITYISGNLPFFLQVADGNLGAAIAGVTSALCDALAHVYCRSTMPLERNDAVFIQETAEYLTARIASYRDAIRKESEAAK